MSLFPLFARLDGKGVLVVGGGAIAERKIRLLLKTGACLRVLAPMFAEPVLQLAQNGNIELVNGVFEPGQLTDAWLVVAATNDAAVNLEVARAACQRKLFVNVVDDALLSTVHIPAIIDRGPLMIGVSSSGAAPMIARAVRERVEACIDHGVSHVVRLAQKHRAGIRTAIPEPAARRDFYEGLLRGPVMQLAQANKSDEAEQALLDALSHEIRGRQGCVVLVGAQGDDPGNLTLNGLRALNQADIIFSESRVNPCFLELARRDAARARLDTHGQEPCGSITLSARHEILGHALDEKNVVVLHAQEPLLSHDADRAFYTAHGVAFHALPGVSASQPRPTPIFSPGMPVPPRRAGVFTTQKCEQLAKGEA